jgi:lipopolysaccharide biosynthesis regulator YciM
VIIELAGSPLKLGVVYAHEGLLDDAEQEFRAAITAGEDVTLARKLLLSVKQMRR